MMVTKKLGKNGSGPAKTATETISDFCIEFVKSNEILLAKAQELEHIEWRTLDVPKAAHMTVYWAGYNDDTILIDVVVRDWFIRKLQEEYVQASEEK